MRATVDMSGHIMAGAGFVEAKKGSLNSSPWRAYMLTALDAPEDLLDKHEKKFVASVREHGWLRTNVFAEAEHLGFCYTTGIWKTLGLPELIAFSIKSDAAHGIFW